MASCTGISCHDYASVHPSLVPGVCRRVHLVRFVLAGREVEGPSLKIDIH